MSYFVLVSVSHPFIECNVFYFHTQWLSHYYSYLNYILSLKWFEWVEEEEKTKDSIELMENPPFTSASDENDEKGGSRNGRNEIEKKGRKIERSEVNTIKKDEENHSI